MESLVKLIRLCPIRTGTATSAPGLGSPPPHLRGGLGSPPPHLRRGWAHPRHICAGTGLGSPPRHLRRDFTHSRFLALRAVSLHPTIAYPQPRSTHTHIHTNKRTHAHTHRHTRMRHALAHAHARTDIHARTRAHTCAQTCSHAHARGCAQVTRFLCAARPGIGTRLLIAASPLTGGGIGAVGGERAPLRKRLRAVGADFVAGWVRTGTLRAARRIRPTPAFAPRLPVCLFVCRGWCPLGLSPPPRAHARRRAAPHPL
jgi:hypothetical protein